MIINNVQVNQVNMAQVNPVCSSPAACKNAINLNPADSPFELDQSLVNLNRNVKHFRSCAAANSMSSIAAWIRLTVYQFEFHTTS